MTIDDTDDTCTGIEDKDDVDDDTDNNESR